MHHLFPLQTFVARFCGLSMDDDCVVLSRNAYLGPGPGMSICKRSQVLVHGKLFVPLEEVVSHNCGPCL